ncbi:MAG TPA: hypothetical protein PK264_01830, partial [Hyphomicrobiaceae bacterium]|nr:hypothetical protein [Hyphomicrobiaceae bacterium]
STELDHASTRDDLDALLAEDGLTLEPKGSGFVVGNAASYVKLSRLPLQHGAKGLARRRPPPRSKRPKAVRRKPLSRNLWTVDAVDIARRLGTREQLRAAIQDARGHRKARLARAPLMTQLMEEMKETLKASTALSRKPQRPPRRRRPGDKQSRTDYRDR